MPKESELDLIKSQKRHEPICTERAGDVTILLAWLDDEISSQQLRAQRSWTGNNVKYWAASVFKAAYKRGELKVKRAN